MKYKHKLVCGVGVNDANYETQLGRGLSKWTCPFYAKWSNMIRRCYTDHYHTYDKATMCDAWLIFSNFKSWMEKQNWQGKDLDKDIAVSNNKIYSPETCIFISSDLNKLLTDTGTKRGDYPKGVSLNDGKFLARCSVRGRRKHIGRFDTPEEAFTAYKEYKSNHILELSEEHDEPLKSYLVRISKEVLDEQ